MTNNDLEAEWRKSSPTCRTCGWCPAYYEVSEDLVLTEEGTETEDCYWAPCVSKDDENAWDHKGYFLYVKK